MGRANTKMQYRGLQQDLSDKERLSVLEKLKSYSDFIENRSWMINGPSDYFVVHPVKQECSPFLLSRKPR